MRERWRRLETRLCAAEAGVREARRDGAARLAAMVATAKEFREGLRDNPAKREQRAH